MTRITAEMCTELSTKTDEPKMRCKQALLYCHGDLKAAEEVLLRRRGQPIPAPDNGPDEVWVTADGRRINIADMDGEHAKNVLRIILRGLRRAREEAQMRKSLKLIFELAEADEHDPWGDE